MFKRCILWMSVRRLLYVIRYECLIDVFCVLWMGQRRLLYVMNVLNIYIFVRYECLENIFCTL